MPSDDLVPALCQRLRGKFSGTIRTDRFYRLLYSTDASNYQIEPLAVAFPKSTEDVAALVEEACQLGIPVLPRGSGSSLAGQAVGEAVVLDLSAHMDGLLEIDEHSATARVQPGLVIDRLNARLAGLGLMFGPDPASSDRATVGGTLANNGTGAHSILYGMAGDNVLSAQVVLYNGSVLELHPVDSIDPDSNHQPLLQRLLWMRRRYGTLIAQKFPRHWRRASGYSLNYLVGEPFFPARLLAGSEGTLAIATELTLKLVRRPRAQVLAVFQFDHLRTAMELVPAILEHRPAAVELIGKMLIELARQQRLWASRLDFVSGLPEAVIAVEFYGEDEAEASARATSLARSLGLPAYFASHPQERAKVWSVRKAGLNLLMSRRSDWKPVPCIDDVSVPVEHLAQYVAAIQELTSELGTTAAFYGHASAGCLHIRPLVNLKEAAGVEMMRQLVEGALELALRWGGVLSGEHGDGLQRSAYNERLFGAEIYAVMKELKATFDPAGILNPGKVVDGPPITENLRYGKGYNPLQVSTYLDWSADGGFVRAVEMCNGSGVCRKLGEGTMCPSYMATRDEQDTTRARANALRAALTGRLPPEALTGSEMYRVLDLCVECKACKTECPTSVDMAKMKTEFLAHYYSVHGVPLRARLFAKIHTLATLSAPVAPLANLLIQSPLASALAPFLGLHRARKLPAFARPTFEAWWKRRSPSGSTRGRVLYFHDTWTNFFQPSVGMAAVALLQAAGFAVEIVPRHPCCGRPMLSKGLVADARTSASAVVDALYPLVRTGIPVVGTEPSCILTFRDEYPSLLPDDIRVQALAEGSYLLDEFLTANLSQEELKTLFSENPAQVALFHGHCHQKALVGTSSSLRLLETAGYQVRDSGAGCCGMAGSFGYEAEHYETSRLMAMDRLLPAIQNCGKDDLVVTSGFSCRSQIQDFSGRQACHLAEALARRLRIPTS
jgi:FAD/FMN-containing dehydrogenase/Fe-S oxidoreductase